MSDTRSSAPDRRELVLRGEWFASLSDVERALLGELTLGQVEEMFGRWRRERRPRARRRPADEPPDLCAGA